MNPSEQEIEAALRLAPQPKPPANLKGLLLAQVALPAPRESQAAFARPAPGGWLRRWWPALAPATAALACAVVLTVQQTEIRDLKQSIQALSQTTSPVAPSTPQTTPANDESAARDAALREQQEISRLKELVRQLTAEITQLEKVQKDNDHLRSQLATATRGLPQEVLDAREQMLKARDQAMTIACVNNLKQLGLAMRMWANDNLDKLPPDILSMTNELHTPKVLVCPADTNRPTAKSWSLYTPANCSYEYLSPSGNVTEPDRVVFRCPIHGSIGLCDGSAQEGVGREHPELLIERDGKLYFERAARPAAPKP